MKKYAVFIIIILSINLIVAPSFIFQKNETVNFRFRCFDNNTNSYCNNSTQLIINIEFPNGSNALNNQSMTFNETFFNVSLNTKVLGVYTAIIHSPSKNGTQSEFTYEITTTGDVLSTGQGIIYIIFLIAAMSAFGLTLYGAIMIPYRNPPNPDGHQIGIHEFGYLKVVLIVFSYIMLMWIFGIVRSITFNYLFINGSYNFFNWAFRIMFAFMWPLIVMSFLLLLVNYISAKKFQKMLERGLPTRDIR